MAIAFRSVKGLVDKVIQATTKAVTSKNQTFNASDDGIDGYSSFTVDITMDGNATTANVRKNKTFYNSSLTKQTGTMTEYSGNLGTGTAGSNFTVPEGYHTGTSYVKCPGGSLSSKVKLWENTSPTSQFNAQTISLTGGNLSSFTHVIFTWCPDVTTTDDTMSIIFSVNDLKNSTYTTAKKCCLLTGYVTSSASYRGTRYITYTSDTQISISACVGLSSAAAAINNKQGIPLSVYGVNLT